MGIGVSALFPLGDVADRHSIGYGVMLPFALQDPDGPLGIQLELGYGMLPGDGTLPGTNGGSNDIAPLHLWSGTLSGVIRKALSPEKTSSFYILGGGGVHHIRSVLEDVNRWNTQSNPTVGSVHGGAGFDFKVGTRTRFFIESRIVHAFTEGDGTTYVPVTIGFKR